MTASTFFVIELVLRLFDPLGVSYFSEVDAYFDILETKDNYSYIHPALMDEIFQGVSVQTNSRGLRGPEFPFQKPEGLKRLLILGDSIVFGWGVEYENTFPALIQRNFDLSDIHTEVIPAGVCSWNTRTEYEYFKREAIKFSPDILMLVIVGNDTDPKDNSNIEIGKEELLDLVYRPNTEQDILRRIWFGLVELSYVFRHFQFAVKMLTEKDYEKITGRDDLTWLDTQLALDGMISLCEEEGVSFIPVLYGGSESYMTHPILSMYAEYFDENSIDYFTVPEKLFSSSRYQNSAIDNHPNPEGHRIIAGHLFRILTETD